METGKRTQRFVFPIALAFLNLCSPLATSHSLAESLSLHLTQPSLKHVQPSLSQTCSNEKNLPLLSKSLASISQTSLSSRPHRIPLKQTRKTKTVTKQEAHPRTFDEDDSSGDDRTFLSPLQVLVCSSFRIRFSLL